MEWVDSIRTTGWRPAAECQRDLEQPDFISCESVGWLVGENEQRVVLALNAQSIEGSEPMVGETIVIPRGAVLRLEVLHEPHRDEAE